MDSNSKSVFVDNVEFTIKKYNVTTGTMIFFKLKKAIAAPLAKILSAVGAKEDEQIDALADALKEFSEAVSPEEGIDLIKDLLLKGNVWIGDKRLTHLDELAEKEVDPYYAIFTLAAQVAMFNYQGFVKKLMGDRISLMPEAAESKSSQKENLNS